ncbi:MAG: F-box protein [Proteobacteria bacterium]|nr:F-box protein [Pseudomonadota bacterium]
MKRGIESTDDNSSFAVKKQRTEDHLPLNTLSLNHLPVDILRHIFKFFSPYKQINIISQVSKLWRNLNWSFSQELMQKYFPYLERLHPTIFNDSPIMLLSKISHYHKQRYSKGKTTIPFNIVLEALSGNSKIITVDENVKNQEKLWALYLVNGHPLPELQDNYFYNRIYLKAFLIAAENGCLQTVLCLKEKYDNDENANFEEEDQEKLLTKIAAYGKTNIVKAMCSWPKIEDEKLLSFDDCDKAEAFTAALIGNHLKVAMYLINHFYFDLEKVGNILEYDNINLTDNEQLKSFFQGLRKKTKLLLLGNACHNDVKWIQPYLFDEKLPETHLISVANAKDPISELKKCLEKYQTPEIYIFNLIQDQRLTEEILDVYLSKLSWPYKTVLLLTGHASIGKKLIDNPEISWQCKREAFAYALIQGNAEEFIDLMKNNNQLWNEELQLLELVALGTLKEIQTFMLRHKLSQDALECANFVANCRNDREIINHLLDSLENKVDELNLTSNFEKIIIRLIKKGLMPRNVATNFLSTSIINLEMIPYLPDFYPEILTVAAKSADHNLLNAIIHHPSISAQHKSKALFDAIEYNFANSHLNIVEDLLATKQISLNDVKNARDIAKSNCLDRLVTTLENHLKNESLQISAASLTFTPAMQAINASQTEKESTEVNDKAKVEINKSST